MPLFAAPLRSGDAARSSFVYPVGRWPATGRLRLLTVLATAEAEAFTVDHDPTEAAPFRVMDAILRHQPARSTTSAAQPISDAVPFNLDSAESELKEATMIVIGVSRPLEIG